MDAATEPTWTYLRRVYERYMASAAIEKIASLDPTAWMPTGEGRYHAGMLKDPLNKIE